MYGGGSGVDEADRGVAGRGREGGGGRAARERDGDGEAGRKEHGDGDDSRGEGWGRGRRRRGGKRVEYRVRKGLVDCFVWMFVERNEAFGGQNRMELSECWLNNGWDCHFRSFSLLLIVLYSPSVYVT